MKRAEHFVLTDLAYDSVVDLEPLHAAFALVLALLALVLALALSSTFAFGLALALAFAFAFAFVWRFCGSALRWWHSAPKKLPRPRDQLPLEESFALGLRSHRFRRANLERSDMLLGT